MDHGISKALSFDEPDGEGVELSTDTRVEREIRTRDGRNERFDPTER